MDSEFQHCTATILLMCLVQVYAEIASENSIESTRGSLGTIYLSQTCTTMASFYKSLIELIKEDMKGNDIGHVSVKVPKILELLTSYTDAN